MNDLVYIMHILRDLLTVKTRNVWKRLSHNVQRDVTLSDSPATDVRGSNDKHVADVGERILIVN